MNEYFSPSSTAYLDLGQCFQNCALTLYSITFPWLQTANQIIGYSVSPHLVNRIDVEANLRPLRRSLLQNYREEAHPTESMSHVMTKVS